MPTKWCPHKIKWSLATTDVPEEKYKPFFAQLFS
jgi:hypothetical protein